MPAYKPTFANLVASPTETAWAQAYTAGSLFAVLALTGTAEDDLKTLGKTIFSSLQAEFFPLEEKNLTTIKTAITDAISDAPKEITLSFVLAFEKEDVLYIFIAGSGKVLLRRANQIATILSVPEKTDEVKAASGKITDNDMLILQTQQCTEIISEESLSTALVDSVEESAEIFMPQLHGQDEGGAAALLIRFAPYAAVIDETDEDAVIGEPAGEEPITHAVEPSHEEESIRTTPEEEILHKEFPEATRIRTKSPLLTKLTSLPLRFGLKRTLLFLLLAVALILVLVVSVFIVQNNQQTKKSHSAFQTVYETAKKQYDEGQDLLGLNDALAKDDFTKAKTTLENGKGTAQKGSDDEKQLNDLLAQVNTALGANETGQKATLTEAGTDASPVLNAAISNTDAQYVSTDKNIVYTASNKNISSITDDKAKELVPNDSDWTTLGGFGVYNGNVYLLDKKAGILKFVAGSDGYGKSSYFKDTNPDVSNAVSLSIDGSVWVLYKDGSILKFTKGTADTFTVSGLLKPAQQPAALFTNADTENLYILDAAGRLIVLAKDGNFKTQYQSDDLKGASMLDVSEKDKKAYILKDKKILELKLQ